MQENRCWGWGAGLKSHVRSQSPSHTVQHDDNYLMGREETARQRLETFHSTAVRIREMTVVVMTIKEAGNRTRDIYMCNKKDRETKEIPCDRRHENSININIRKLPIRPVQKIPITYADT